MGATQALDLSERSLRRLQHIDRSEGAIGLARREWADAGYGTGQVHLVSVVPSECNGSSFPRRVE